MRKFLGITGLAAAALYVWAQGSGAGLLGGFQKALTEAQTLTAEYTVMRNLGAKTPIRIDLAKPNMAKIDRPNELIVADGTTITTYDKVNKTYLKQAQTPADLREKLSADEYVVWSAFFMPDAFAKISSKNLGKKNRKGMVLNVVEAKADAEGRKVVTLYLSDKDNIARQAEIVVNNPDAKDSLVLDTTNLVVGATVDASLFAFKAPDGSRQLTADELNSAKWYTDLDEGLKVAARTKRLVLLDFYTVW